MPFDPHTGETKRGQDFDRERGLVFKYVEYVENFEQGGTSIAWGNDFTEIVVLDANSSRIRVYDATTIATAIADEFVTFPATVSFSLPPTLVSLTTVYNENKGNGTGSFGDPTATPPQSTFVSAGTSANASFSPRVNAQGSISVQVDVLAVIRPNPADEVPATAFTTFVAGDSTLTQLRVKATRLTVSGSTFNITIASPGVYTTGGSFSVGDEVFLTTSGTLPTGLNSATPYFIIAANKLAIVAGGSAINTSGSQSGVHTMRKAIKAWPRFKTDQVEVICAGQELNLQQTAESQAQYNLSDSSYSFSTSFGDSSQQSRGGTIHKITFPQTLHGTLNIAGGTSKTSTVTTSVKADTIDVTASTTTPPASITMPGIVNHPTGLSESLTSFVTPTSFSATSPADIPTSGLYFYHPSGNLDVFGLVAVTAYIVDFSYFS